VTVATTTVAASLDPKYGQSWQRRSLLRSGENRFCPGSTKRLLTPPQPPDLAVWVVGELSYANGHLPSWESWLTQMQRSRTKHDACQTKNGTVVAKLVRTLDPMMLQLLLLLLLLLLLWLLLLLQPSPSKSTPSPAQNLMVEPNLNRHLY
jgi:hypothetical protein